MRSKRDEKSRADWQSSFMVAVRNHPDRSQSFDILTRAGVAEEVIVEALRDYTSDEARERVSFGRKLSQMHRDAIETFLPHLQKLQGTMLIDSEDVEQLPAGWPLDLYMQSSERDCELTASLAALLGFLKPFCSEKGAERDDYQLVRLCVIVKIITGTPHWRDIAELLEAAYAASKRRGPQARWDTDKLRKLHDRYRRMSRTVYEQLLEDAKQVQATELSPSEEAMKRSSKNRRIRMPEEAQDTTGISRYIVRL